MKLTIRQIHESLPAIKKIIKAEIPIKVAFAFNGLVEQVDNNIKFFEEKRNAAIEKFGSKNKAGQMEVKSKSPKYKPFIKAINEVLDLEIDFDFEPVQVEYLEFNLTTEEFRTVKHFFKQ